MYFKDPYGTLNNVDCLIRGQFFFAVLEFDHPIPVVPKSLVIGSKLDTDIHSNACRIAFKGNIQFIFENDNYRGDLVRLKVYKTKTRVSRLKFPLISCRSIFYEIQLLILTSDLKRKVLLNEWLHRARL